MKTRNDCEIACDCVKRANVVLHGGLCKEIFARKHTDTHKPTSAQPTHMCHDVSEVFVSTDGRRACRRVAIGSTMGAYPRDTGSNPVEGNGHFFPSHRQLYLSSFSDTPRPTQRRSLQMLGVAVPQIGVGVFHG